MLTGVGVARKVDHVLLIWAEDIGGDYQFSTSLSYGMKSSAYSAMALKVMVVQWRHEIGGQADIVKTNHYESFLWDQRNPTSMRTEITPGPLKIIGCQKKWLWEVGNLPKEMMGCFFASTEGRRVPPLSGEEIQ